MSAPVAHYLNSQTVLSAACCLTDLIFRLHLQSRAKHVSNRFLCDPNEILDYYWSSCCCNYVVLLKGSSEICLCTWDLVMPLMSRITWYLTECQHLNVLTSLGTTYTSSEYNSVDSSYVHDNWKFHSHSVSKFVLKFWYPHYFMAFHSVRNRLTASIWLSIICLCFELFSIFVGFTLFRTSLSVLCTFFQDER